MDSSRDSSVWRSLAVAFGDGLAFGVGMKLTQNAAGKPGVPAAAPSDLAGRLARVEQRVERIEHTPAAVGAPGSPDADADVFNALAHALEARLQENAALLDRRLADLEMRLAVELKALRQQDQALASGTETEIADIHQRFNEQVLELRQKVNEDRNGLQNQVVALHREFAAAVADIVEEQVVNQVEQRLADAVAAQLGPIEQRLRDEIRQAAADKNREFSDLRQRVAESDRNALDVLLNVSELFRQAAGRRGAAPAPEQTSPEAGPEVNPAEASAAPEAPPPAPPAPAADTQQATEVNGVPSTSETPAPVSLFQDSDLPGFAQPRKASAAWSVPLVSSFVITAACVLALQYL